MIEGKENKSSAMVRLPSDLISDLRKEQAPYLARGEEAPSFGALLSKAWKNHKALAGLPAEQIADLLIIAEALRAPDSTENRPLKAQVKVTLNEHRKRKEDAAKAAGASPH